MSFDIYLQSFADDSKDRGPVVMQLLAPLLDASRAQILTADGSAAVYGIDDGQLDGIMFNRIDGLLAWHVIFDVAVAADWVISPVGAPVCIVAADQADRLDEELKAEGVVLVDSGRVLLETVMSEV